MNEIQTVLTIYKQKLADANEKEILQQAQTTILSEENENLKQKIEELNNLVSELEAQVNELKQTINKIREEGEKEVVVAELIQ